jgi:hypothetical protein
VAAPQIYVLLAGMVEACRINSTFALGKPVDMGFSQGVLYLR